MMRNSNHYLQDGRKHSQVTNTDRLIPDGDDGDEDPEIVLARSREQSVMIQNPSAPSGTDRVHTDDGGIGYNVETPNRSH